MQESHVRSLDEEDLLGGERERERERERDMHEMFPFEEISSFPLFLSLITEEGFLISPCYSLELCIQMGISFLFFFAFSFFSFLSYL